MKKILSTIVAALVAVSFAAIVFAEDVPHSEHEGAAQGAEGRREEIKRQEAKPMQKHNKPIKHRRQIKHKKPIRKHEQHQ
jgi:uncharacterized protein YxeA